MAAAHQGDLYVIAVGANRFPGFGPGSGIKDLTLRHAADDAKEVAAMLGLTEGKDYRHVFPVVLADDTDHDPTKAAIRTALDGLKRVGPDDTAVVFLASHGLSDDAGNYYMLPRDGRPADVLAILQGHDRSGTLPSMLGWEEIFDALRQAAGRRVLVVDTCRARDVAAEAMSHTLRKRSAAALFALMLASKGDEDSQELDARGHGVFTWGMLQAMRGAARADASGRITLTAAFDYARQVVEKERPDKRLPQTPQLLAPARLGEVVLATAPR